MFIGRAIFTNWDSTHTHTHMCVVCGLMDVWMILFANMWLKLITYVRVNIHENVCTHIHICVCVRMWLQNIPNVTDYHLNEISHWHVQRFKVAFRMCCGCDDNLCVFVPLPTCMSICIFYDILYSLLVYVNVQIYVIYNYVKGQIFFFRSKLWWICVVFQ